MRRWLHAGVDATLALLVTTDQGSLRGAGEPASARAPLASFEARIAALEYRATPNRAGLQAPNRAHALRTYFEPTGIRVVDRSAESTELLRMSLVGVGRGAALAPAEAGAVRSAGARVEIQRPGLTEWYENSPQGLEQGFSIVERPDGSEPLVLELALTGADAAHLDEDALALRTSSGRTLQYDHLVAWDARGAALDARLELAARDRVRLVVDDATARYPIEIDPILTQGADTLLRTPPSATGFPVFFGASVASAGDTNGDGFADLLIGAPFFDAGASDAGAAFIWLGSAGGIPSGLSATATTLLLSDQSSAAFGLAVSSAGDVNGDGYADVAVAAPYYDEGESQEGAVFLYHGGPSGVASTTSLGQAVTKLQGNQVSAAIPIGGDGGIFGWKVASAGDVNGDGYDDLMVGAPWYVDTTVGFVFLYLGSASGIPSGDPGTANTRIGLPPGETAHSDALHSFGSWVSSAGDVNSDGYDDVVFGAPIFHGVSPSGAAYLFHGSATGIASGTTAAATTQLTGGGGAIGTRVSGAGDVNGDGYGDVLVSSSGLTGEGAVFVFHGGPAGIPSGNESGAATALLATPAQTLFGGIRHVQVGSLPTGGAAGAGDINGDGYSDIIVAADPLGTPRAYVFLGAATGIPSGSELLAAAVLFPTDAEPGGFTAAGAGDTNGDGFDDVVLGNTSYSPLGMYNGAAWVYLGGTRLIAHGTAASASARLDGTQTGAQLGASAASAGDVNGDGYSDVIVGAPFYDSGEPDEGAAFVFHGSASGIAAGSPGSAATTLQSNLGSSEFGRSVDTAGDVNRDGYSDVVVGAPLYDDGQTNEGEAFVFLGGPAGVASAGAASAYARIQGDQSEARLGASVAPAGDVNADGYPDLIVGAPRYNAGVASEGAAFVFHSSAAGLGNGSPATANATLRGAQTEAELGQSVASAGDFDADGFADVVVGAPAHGGGGLALLYRGSAAGIGGGTPSNAAVQFLPGTGAARMGTSVAGAGDMNRDGFDDVIVGAPDHMALPAGTGGAFVYAGRAEPPAVLFTVDAMSAIYSSSFEGNLGASVAGAGDLNADGFADIAIGDADPLEPFGTVWVFYGSALPELAAQDIMAGTVIEGDQTFAAFGASVAGAGDVNGDGFADLAIGAPLQEAPGADTGAAFLFYGTGVSGRSVQTRQRSGDAAAVLVPPPGDSRRGDGFLAQIRARHPRGNGRVRAEVQACPANIAFGLPGCVNATFPGWISVSGAFPSINLSIPVNGLPPATPIHWRARVLLADATGPLPLHPMPGPWRRPYARAGAADIRTSADADLDTIANTADNCVYRANLGQEDAGGFGAASPADGFGDVCQCGHVAGSGRVDGADVSAYRAALAGGTPLSPEAQSRCVVVGSPAGPCSILQLSVIQRALQVPPLPPITSSALAQVCAATLP